MTLGPFAFKRLGLHKIYAKIKNGVVTCDKKNLPWFVVRYDFCPTPCMFSIPSPRLGDRKHTTCWIKIIFNHKPWEILYIYTIPYQMSVMYLYAFNAITCLC